MEKNEKKNFNREERFKNMMSILAGFYEEKGDFKIARNFRRAMTPSDLPNREHEIFEREMKQLEDDVFSS